MMHPKICTMPLLPMQMGCEGVDYGQEPEGERDVGGDTTWAQTMIALFGHYVSFSFFTAHHHTATTSISTASHSPSHLYHHDDSVMSHHHHSHPHSYPTTNYQ
jgi:hypothetical protein